MELALKIWKVLQNKEVISQRHYRISNNGVWQSKRKSEKLIKWRNFRKFRKFWPNSRKLMFAKKEIF